MEERALCVRLSATGTRSYAAALTRSNAGQESCRVTSAITATLGQTRDRQSIRPIPAPRTSMAISFAGASRAVSKATRFQGDIFVLCGDPALAGCDRAIPNPNLLIKSFAYKINYLLKDIILLYSPGSYANALDADL
jgi:hypothetical protein